MDQNQDETHSESNPLTLTQDFLLPPHLTS